MDEETQAEFRKKLVDMRAGLLNRIGKISADRTQEEGPLSADFAEQAVELENEEVLSALDVSSRREVEQINAALERIEASVYGECVECGNKIPTKRLEAIPYAVLCVECAESHE